VIGLGTRWRFGSPPPARLPEAAAAAIARAEEELRETAPETTSASWTLTWLEGRPVAELDHETGQGFPIVTVDPVSGEGRLTYER
jgi:hypothetical protein